VHPADLGFSPLHRGGEADGSERRLNKLQDDVILAIAEVQKLGRNVSSKYMRLS
jgi:hypothetical protein